MLLLIDRGHGFETKGKRSLDGRVVEWEWNDQFARELARQAKAIGIDARLVVDVKSDIPLSVRTRFVNEQIKSCGHNNVLLLSVHCNAENATSGYGNTARGFLAYVSLNASNKSRWFATELQKRMWANGYRGNRANSQYQIKNLAICRDTLCPAVLGEYMFMTNKEDVDMLCDWNHVKAMIKITLETIVQYRNTYVP